MNGCFARSLFVLMFLSGSVAFPQNIDSLGNVVRTTRSDTVRIDALCSIAYFYKASRPDSSFHLYEQALGLSEKAGWDKGKALALSGIGLYYSQRGDFKQALTNLFDALKISGENNKTKLTASIMANIGIVYMTQTNHAHSLEYSLRALKIMEELGERKWVARILGNAGSVYNSRGDDAKALDNYTKALVIAEELGDKNLQSSLVGNIGIVYYNRKNFKKAEGYFLKAKQLAEETGNKYNIARNLGNLANAYSLMNDQYKAIECLEQSLKIQESTGMQSSMGHDILNMGYAYLRLGDLKEAEACFKRSEKLLTGSGSHITLSDLDQALHNLYDTLATRAKRGKIDGKSEADFLRMSLMYYKRNRAETDTVYSEEQKELLIRSEINYEFEKKQAISKAEYNEDRKRQTLLLWFIVAIALAIGVIAAVVFRSLRVTRKQKQEIEAQKKLVDEKNKNITDSINYAKKIQQSLLPTEKYIERLLK